MASRLNLRRPILLERGLQVLESAALLSGIRPPTRSGKRGGEGLEPRKGATETGALGRSSVSLRKSLLPHEIDKQYV